MAWRNRLAQARVGDNNNNAIIQSSMRDRLNESTALPGTSHPDNAAYSFDQVLKKLETTKQQRHNKGVQSSSPSSSSMMNARHHTPRTPSGRQVTVMNANDSYDDDDSSSDSRNGGRFFTSGDVNDEYFPGDNGSIGSSSNEQQQQRLIETRQQFVDRQVDYSPHYHGSSHHNTVVDSFIEKQQSTEEWRMESDTDTSNLPSAILKLDQRLSIPAPMHKNDVLVEIEVRYIYM
jgi:hypothetical protein